MTETSFRARYEAASAEQRAAMQIGAVPIVVERPRVSVVMATINEGPDLEATVALIVAGKRVPDELIIVDDGSREPVEARVRPFGRYCDLQVLRNEARAGSGRAKSRGLDHATGDVLVIMDSHMRPPWGWLEVVADSFGRWPYSVMCPWSYGFARQGAGQPRPPDYHHPPTFTGRGARFLPHAHGFWDMAWNPKRSPEPVHGALIGCLLGGCYIFGRELMHHLGGYNRHHAGWGYEQEYLSLRAWAAGFDCRLLNFPVEHHYAHEDHKPDRLDAAGSRQEPWVAWHNRHFAMATLWEEGRYERVYGPLMRAHHMPQGLEEELTRSAGNIAAMRAHLGAIRRRSDQDVGFMLGIPHAENPDQYRAFAAHYGRKAK